MKFDNDKPCKTCPYRMDVPVGIWDWSEYQRLLAQDKDELNGAIFACHQHRHGPRQEHRLCIGWLLDQSRRGLPSIRLRLLLATNREAAALLNAAHCETPLYDSIEEMCAANKGKPFPTRCR